MIEVKNLTKTFNGRKALDSVSFQVKQGEVFGLLGTNGAGKSTLMNIMVGLLSATSGKINIKGRDHEDEKQNIGYCFGFSEYMPLLTGRENLRFFGMFYGLDRKEFEERIEVLAKKVKLKELDKDVNNYSSGMTQKLSLIKALIHDPEIVLVDELTVGLDVGSAHAIRRLLKELKGQKTILFTTHYMQEAEELCDRIALMKQGKILAVGTTSELKERFEAESLEEVFLKIGGDLIESN